MSHTNYYFHEMLGFLIRKILFFGQEFFASNTFDLICLCILYVFIFDEC